MNEIETNIKVNSNWQQNQNNELVKVLYQEIKGENIRIFILNLSSWLVFLLAWILLILSVTLKSENLSFFLSFWFVIPLIFLSFWLIVINGVLAYNFRQEKKVHFNFNQIDENRLPIFIVNTYKRNLGIKIFINWLAIVSYILITITLIVLFWLKGQKDPFFNVGNLKIVIESTFDHFTKEIILLFSGLGLMFFLHVFTFVNTSRRKINLNNLFDVERKIDKSDLNNYKKKVNLLCAAFFLTPLFILLIILWILKKRKSK